MIRAIALFLVSCSALRAYPQATPSVPTAPNLPDSNAKAQVFAPGAASTPFDEWATSFTPDGHTVFVSRGGVYWTIVFSKWSNGQWGRPQVAPFSGRWRDTDPFVSPDGKRLFFISNRPLPGMPGDKAQVNFHLWYVDHLSGDDWSDPHHLDSPVNREGVNNYAPSVSRSGTLFFCSRGRDGHEGMASYSAAPQGMGYEKPQLLSLLGQEDTQDPFIDPDERYVVFISGNDICISYKQGGQWLPGQKFGPEVNDGSGNSSPAISRDGKTLYYSSNRVKGFYKRDHTVDYEGLLSEMQGLFNGNGNILMIPIDLPGAGH